MKTRRSWMLAVAMLSLTAGGVWAGVVLANNQKAADCCLDPTCPPGCSPACPPGCSPDCPPNCLDGATAKTSSVKAEAKTCDGGKCDGGKCSPKGYCPPCPFCP